MKLNLNNNAPAQVWTCSGLDADQAIALGKKVQAHASDAGHLEISFWDDFNQHILHAGNYLLKLGSAVYWADQNQVLAQYQQKLPCFASEIACPGLAGKVAPLIGFRQLEAVASLRLQSREWVFRDDEGKAVCRAICWHSNSNCLVQVLPIRGYEKFHKKLEKSLQALGGKPASGGLVPNLFALTGIELTDYTTKPIFGLHPGHSAGETVRDMVLTMLQVAQCNEAGIIHKPQDTEYLHDYRISLRKVRSIVSLLKAIFPKDLHSHLKSRLSELMAPTNRARDLDVYILEKDTLSNLLPTHLAAGLPLMFADFEREHAKVYSDLKKWLSSKAYQAQIGNVQSLFAALNLDGLTETAATPVLQLVNQNLKKHYKKVNKIGSSITPETPDEQVHELRLECKKFRYLLEFFAELYPKKVLDQVLKRLKKLQNTLGAFNDYSVQQESLHDYLEGAKANKSLHMSVGALIMVLAQKQHEERLRVEQRFAEFAKPETASLVEQLIEQES